MFDYVIHKENNNIIAEMFGDLDIDSTEEVEGPFLSSLLEGKNVKLDFQYVKFVDSTGIGLLMKTVQKLQSKDIEVVIANVNEDIQAVFDILQLTEILGKDIFV
ncbi:STAS domain-containing protein [Salirhabdus salicampi]|uniref:STAS domain-containing protein n=1 Tax=Salirhabdus salicampi TaxID=476102 RepID=UPI0020C44158|nr:STAS domain-containing protein [Salirhabdus salicampi]